MRSSCVQSSGILEGSYGALGPDGEKPYGYLLDMAWTDDQRPEDASEMAAGRYADAESSGGPPVCLGSHSQSRSRRSIARRRSCPRSLLLRVCVHSQKLSEQAYLGGFSPLLSCPLPPYPQPSSQIALSLRLSFPPGCLASSICPICRPHV